MYLDNISELLIAQRGKVINVGVHIYVYMCLLMTKKN